MLGVALSIFTPVVCLCAPDKQVFTVEEALTNALFHDGMVAIAPKEKGELMEWNAEPADGSWNKALLVVPDGAQASKVLLTIGGSHSFGWNETIQLNPNSQLFAARLVETTSRVSMAQQWLAGKDSLSQNANAWLNEGIVTASVQCSLSKGSHVEQLDAALLNGQSKLAGRLCLNHDEENTVSYSVFKGVLQDSARSDWNAMIRIPKGGQRSNAMLEAHSLVDGAKACSANIPSLEIEADDVQASHSASVTQLNEEHVFYLRSRGLGESQAKPIMVGGFLESIWYRLPNAYHPQFEARLAKLLEQG